MPPELAIYRRSGADPPFGDPRRAHGVAMEGYYWRFTDAAQGRAVITLCGVCRARDGTWATNAIAAHPEGLLQTQVAASASADPERLGIAAGKALIADATRLQADLGGGVALQVSVRDGRPWPRRLYGGLGAAHWVPGLGQYWHPHLLGGRVDGQLVIGDRRVSLDGARVYAEKNWGSAFPRRWWWGQAHDFGDDDVCVAFAGGVVVPGMTASAIVTRIGDELIRLSAPLALVRARAGARSWQLAGRGPRHTVRIDGQALSEPFRLPVPIPAERRHLPLARQHLAGAMRLTVHRGRRLLFRGETELAGLEFGEHEGA